MRVPRALAAAALLLCASQASAHAFLATAAPAVGATVRQPPDQVVIGFTQGVEPGFSSIAVQDGSGARVDTGPLHPLDDGTHLAIALRPLQPGSYTVTWHATSTDTHRTQGTYSFTVGP